ncbi:MAG: hypothetical protein UU24_C0007G0009 [Candidatus Nomurabacteria bacterium GW2011_GWA2_40_9]|uniref:Pilus assembly protein, PilO n=1 Tax=Candidatus Nomurabacteria bacterium GW2011_GWA2_40_9 TaxID=1618734 RepID=A0A0G0WVN5_9BACT|nr:MAG: hypothetical protein UU24_C0007G0009 [Candidatus Nomurabacteria bacterium GW2011_GWA2_40_9]
MLRFFIPTILIAVAITGFFMLVNPMYKELSVLKAQMASYNQALDNSKALENERDKLTKKYSDINSENLDKLVKLLPDNVENIRLILEIEKIASPYGMILKDVRYDTAKKDETNNTVTLADGQVNNEFTSKDYGIWSLEFSTEGTYTNFLNFTRDLESNLRIVDISSIQFSAADTGTKFALPETYKYGFKIKTYWMKN